MYKIGIMASQKTITDARDLIMNKMEKEGRTLTWLSVATKIPYNSLYACLKKKSFLLSESNLNKINLALETDYKLNK